MGEVESARYDRSSIQELFDNGVSLALAWKMTGDMTYARHAADALRMWFVSPETRMNPHLRYSQVRRGSNKDLGNGRGNIETKDFYFYLDAVRLIEQSGAMSSSDQNEFRRWLREFLDWLLVSQQGVYECQAENNHGTYYDLQVAAIAAFLDEKELLFKTLIRARNRLSVQFSPEGWQHAEMQRTQTAHYCCFNLQGWLYLSLLARRYGDDLFSHEEKGVALLPQAVKWLSQFIEKKWPYEQIVEFDSDRFAPIVHLAEELGMAIDLPASFRERISKLGDRKPVFHPHDAVSPYWGLLRGVSRFKLLHVVVMRFGIGIFDQQWLEHRFHLLQSITIPSLKQERWGSGMFFVVQIDELLSEEWQERLNVALEGLPFVLQKLQLHSDRRQGLTDFCNKKCEEEGFTHVLTTRIDDDDAFSSGTLDRIRVRASVLFGKGVEFAGFGIQKTLRFLASDSKVLPVSNVEPDAIGLTFFAKAFTEKNIYSYNHRKFRGVIEQFGIFEWLEGCVALYTIHRLSDSDFVSRKKRFGRDDAYVITKSEVAMFGIDKERLSVWVDVDSKYPVLSDGKTTEFVSVKELEIKKERKRLSVLGLNDSDEMRRLLSERVELGRNIISELSSKI